MPRAGGKDSVSSEKANLSLKTGASVLAFCAAFFASPAWAQDGDAATQDGEAAAQGTQTAADDESDIVVTGIRQSLQNAQNIKRESDTVVDAITAQDIGALPDRSV